MKEENTSINIENKYEKQILELEQELQKIYDVVKNLSVYELDPILIDAMKMLSELINTKNISIYHCQQEKYWLRLLESLNEESVIEDKSWNISENSNIYDAIKNGEIYQGIFNENEPDIIMPILCKNDFTIVIVMKKLPQEYKTSYNMNLLKIIYLLLHYSIEKALLYEEISKEEYYITNTDILKPEAFKRRVSLAQEKFERNMAEYCVLEIIHKGSLYEVADKINKTVRVTDCLGIDKNERLFLLLNNTNANDSKYLRNRLLNCGVEDIRLDLC